jgi:hypothetical protein
MRLSESNARWIAQRYADTDHFGLLLRDKLGRFIYEDEADSLLEVLTKVISDVLIDFEFADPEVVARLDSVQLWADDHKGKSYRRPKGKVVYTVTGEVAWQRYALKPRAQPLVKRSSDGETQPMPITELETMVEVTMTK